MSKVKRNIGPLIFMHGVEIAVYALLFKITFTYTSKDTVKLHLKLITIFESNMGSEISVNFNNKRN